MRELKQLRLPQLVEARKRRASMNLESPNSPTTAHILQSSQTSNATSTETTSPITPAYSPRGHGRFPSSTSSLASSPPLRDSLDGFAVGKRPLTEVREEPHEREEDFEMINGFTNSPPDRDTDSFIQAMEAGFPISDPDLFPVPSHYDLTDDHPSEPDFNPSPSAKRRRGDDFSFAGFTQRFGSRMPSLSRGWRQRKAGNISISTQERPSRANSSRTPSLANSFVDMDALDGPLPPTPAMSVSGHRGLDSPVAPLDLQRAESQDEEIDREVKATTPLLPPVLANLPTFTKETPYLSPLQSPTVAEHDPFSATHTPVETPQLRSLPSPTLSNKPSISSFNRQRALSHTTLMPTSDIPPLPITSMPDAWADSLGHANFTIAPEPYVPTQFDVEACKQLRTDWETARRNFSRHLMRTSEHWGTTSRIYKLTEEKWAAIDAEWKRNTDVCLSRTADNGYEKALSQSQSSVAEPAPLAKLPLLNGPMSEGKFPKLGDEHIVGPMEVVESPQQQQQRKSSKRSFFKFLQGVFTPPEVKNLFGKPSNRRAATV
ncbi:MAG: hypothetical protein LQ350_004674 [Teloschistes chrysophthalmus]|nr:MAG: hypothetical protein LQ350_004674 [Niorma chrysophthalma]